MQICLNHFKLYRKWGNNWLVTDCQMKHDVLLSPVCKFVCWETIVCWPQQCPGPGRELWFILHLKLSQHSSSSARLRLVLTTASDSSIYISIWKYSRGNIEIEKVSGCSKTLGKHSVKWFHIGSVSLIGPKFYKNSKF